jgi:hypothetical protein
MDHALSSPQEIEALAVQLTAAADAIHDRALHDKSGDPAAVRALFDEELILRQYANAMLADAAAHVVAGLAASQGALLALTGDAAARMRQIGRIADGLTLAARITALAGAAATGNPAAIVKAGESLYHHVRP